MTIEVYETGIHGKTMVYVEEDGNMKLIDHLFAIKQPTGIYYRKGKKIGYHWLLHPITVDKLKLGLAVQKLPPE